MLPRFPLLSGRLGLQAKRAIGQIAARAVPSGFELDFGCDFHEHSRPGSHCSQSGLMSFLRLQESFVPDQRVGRVPRSVSLTIISTNKHKN